MNVERNTHLLEYMNIIKLQRDIIFGSNDLSFINYYESRVAFQSPDPDFPQGG